MKKILAMALAGVMTAGILTGCGGAGNGDSASKKDYDLYIL